MVGRGAAQKLSVADVVSAYRLFFDRAPESEQAIQSAQRFGSIAALRRAFLRSKEFHAKNGPDASNVLLNAPPSEVEWSIGESEFDALFDHVKSTWTKLGEEQPFWSVLTSERFRSEKLNKRSKASFFATGAECTATLLAVLARNGYEARRFQHLFEFGCGLGRVTPYLARAFETVTACDVSEGHLKVARDVVSRAGAKNVAFELSDSKDFGMRAPFDLWYSKIVLQHNSPPLIARILRRAFSLLNPGGVAAFQVPTYASGYRFSVSDYLANLNDSGVMEMHVLPQGVIFQIAREENCVPLEVVDDNATGSQTWRSNSFLMRKD